MKNVKRKIHKYFNKQNKTLLFWILTGAIALAGAYTFVLGVWAAIGIAIMLVGIAFCLTIIGILLGIFLLGIGFLMFGGALMLIFKGIIWMALVGAIGGFIAGLIINSRQKQNPFSAA